MKLRLVLAALTCAAPAALAQEGAYLLTGPDARGSARIEKQGVDLVLVTTLDAGGERPAARQDPARPGTFIYVKPLQTGGAAGALDGAAAVSTWTVTVKSAGGGLEAVIRKDAQVVSTEQLRPRPAQAGPKAALLVHATAWDTSHAAAFKGYATQMAAYYRLHGYSRTDLLAGAGQESLIAALRRADHEQRPYSRVVIVGHGGWDGPMLSQGGTSQVSWSDHQPLFLEWLAALQAGTTADARLFSSSCHAGGSNRYETGNAYRWVDDVARRAGRIAAGPMGPTSTEYTMQQVLAALEGVGSTKQEVRWASPQGFRTLSAGGTLGGAGAIRPWTDTLPVPASIPAIPPPPASSSTTVVAGYHH